MSRLARPRLAPFLRACALALPVACAYPYRSLEREDWLKVKDGPDFETARAECEGHRDAQPFRYGGDPRRVFAGCMERHGWVPRR